MIFKRPFQRNLQRRRIGGVCAGIAGFFGIAPKWVRLAVLISFFMSFTLTFWIYLALWIFVPAKSQVAIPDVSPALKRQLWNMDRLVRKMHRRLDFYVADQAQDTFDAIKLLAIRFDKLAGGEKTDAQRNWEQGKTRFQTLAEQLMTIPKDYGRTGSTNNSLYRKLVQELDQLHDQLIETSVEAITEESIQAGDGTKHAKNLRQWQKRYQPLKQRLSSRANPDTLAVLSRIEEKIELLLGQENTSEFFDLKPFEVRKIAFEYIPDAIREYLRLPANMAKNRHLDNGKTAEESLQEQFLLLDGALDNLSRSLFQKDARGLLIHGRFLKEKFTDNPFRVAG